MSGGSYEEVMESWYNDENYFPGKGAPWFNRGGLFYMGLGAGVFGHVHIGGNQQNNYSFRVVLAAWRV